MLQCRMWGGDFPIGNAGGGEGREGRWGGFPFVSAGVWWYVTCILCSRGIFLLGMQEGERGGRGHKLTCPPHTFTILARDDRAHSNHHVSSIVQCCELGIGKNPPMP